MVAERPLSSGRVYWLGPGVFSASAVVSTATITTALHAEKHTGGRMSNSQKKGCEGGGLEITTQSSLLTRVRAPIDHAGAEAGRSALYAPGPGEEDAAQDRE